MVDLYQFNQPQAASFNLALADAQDFKCLEIVRCVPRKRLVCRGLWGGQPVYAKLFIGPGAKRYAERDLAGVKALAAANILTPRLLHTGMFALHGDANDGGRILIFREVAQSINAEEALSRLQSPHERLSLAQSLVREVARHHNTGVIQQDMYLKNFLFDTDRTIYTLDGDGIRPISKAFARKQSLQNLAVLLSKFDVMDETAWLPQLLDSYIKERSLMERNLDSAINLERMRKRITVHRRYVVHGYADKKVFRQCSDVQIEKSWKSFTAISRQHVDAALKSALTDPDRLLNDKASKRLKSGNTCTVSLVKAGGRKIVVKRYNIKNAWHALSRMFRPSRAAVSWSNAHRLQMYGIATAAPLLVKEERFGLLRFRAWLLAEYIDAPDVADWMDQSSDAAKQKLAAANLAKLLYKMRLLQIAHGDLKATNIHVVDAQPVLIDLDSLHEYRCRMVFEHRHIRDLRRFLRNWQAKPEIHALMVNALKMVYGDDPILAKAGI